MTTPAQEPSREQRLQEIRHALEADEGKQPFDQTWTSDNANGNWWWLLADNARLEAALRVVQAEVLPSYIKRLDYTRGHEIAEQVQVALEGR